MEVKYLESEFVQKEELTNFIESNVEKLTKAQSRDNKYADSLGWLNVSEHADMKNLEKLEKLASKIRKDADVFVLIGVGGSNNSARAVIEALQVDGPKIVYAGNTLSPFALNKILKELEGKSVYINCIAKNFETLEPGSSFRILRQYLNKVYGDKAAERIIVTGSKNSSLEKLSNDNGYTFLEFPLNVGGRYTALTNVGLFPMAVAGIDIKELAKGTQDMEKELLNASYKENKAYMYACLRNYFGQKGYLVEMLGTFEPQFRYFYKWWIQLFAESEGKDNKGIYPTASEYSEDLHSVGQYVQDGSPIIFETFIDVENKNSSLVFEKDMLEDYFDYLDGKDFWDINKAANKATVLAHSKKLPCIKIDIPELDTYNFGQLFYFFEFSCYLSCEILGVNAFDQPGVEAYKALMFDVLGKK